MTNKIPFEIVELEVAKLYSKEFEASQERAIEDHCEYIATFIESCGWNLYEYMDEYMRRGLKDFLPSGN